MSEFLDQSDITTPETDRRPLSSIDYFLAAFNKILPQITEQLTVEALGSVDTTPQEQYAKQENSPSS